MSRTTSKQDQEFIEALTENINVDRAFIFNWIASHFSPGDVFNSSALEEWAENNGYIKA